MNVKNKYLDKNDLLHREDITTKQSRAVAQLTSRIIKRTNLLENRLEDELFG